MYDEEIEQFWIFVNSIDMHWDITIEVKFTCMIVYKKSYKCVT